MNCIGESSIKCRSTLLTMATTAPAFLLPAAPLFSCNRHAMKAVMLRLLRRLADLVGPSSAPAPTPHNPDETVRTIQVLEIQPNIATACLLLPGGTRTAGSLLPQLDSAADAEAWTVHGRHRKRNNYESNIAGGR